MTAIHLARAVIGGAMIGAAATLYWKANHRIAGVSGVVRSALFSRAERATAVPFLIGLIIAGAVGCVFGVAAPLGGTSDLGAMVALAIAGLLVGVGTQMGGGCTSGHGVCGLSRGSPRSLVAVLTFILTGAITVFVASRGLGGLRLP